MLQPFKILLAEEDRELAIITQNYLVSQGFSTLICLKEEDILQCVKTENIDFLLIDTSITSPDVFNLVEKIRGFRSDMPIILIGANQKHNDIIKGFQVGADDFISIPFSMEELSLRIEAIHKRVKINEKYQHIFTLGNYTLDTIHHVLIYNGREKKLTTKELDLLYLFCEYMNRVVERRMALKRVWKEENYFSARNMDVYIGRLRNMLCEDPNVQLENVHGVGYKLVVHT